MTGLSDNFCVPATAQVEGTDTFLGGNESAGRDRQALKIRMVTMVTVAAGRTLLK